ncbi:MAG: 50S ribosomal protein L25, partial [Gemmatimonadota bacterium]
AYRPTILHVDFLRIQAGVAVELDIPVHLEGTAVGVKDGGGVMDHVVHEVPVRCIPSLIPEVFHLDVTALEIGDTLHVSDIPLEEGVQIMMDDARTICAVVAPRLVEVDEEEEGEEVEVALVGEEGEAEAQDEGEGEDTE